MEKYIDNFIENTVKIQNGKKNLKDFIMIN